MELVEHYGMAWKLKVSRDDYSIGYLFGLMEEIQTKYNISEYSVAQTTLEQIFNNFATQAQQNNPHKKNTLRRSTVGKASKTKPPQTNDHITVSGEKDDIRKYN